MGCWSISGAAGVFRGCWRTLGTPAHLGECWSIGMLQHLEARRAAGEDAGTVGEHRGDATTPGGRAVLLAPPWLAQKGPGRAAHTRASPSGVHTRVQGPSPAGFSHVATARGHSRSRGRRGRVRAPLPPPRAAGCNFSRASARGRSKSTFSPVFLPGGLQPVSC